MKRLIVLLTILFLTSCGTVSKITHKLTTRRDSSATVKKDSSLYTHKDSTNHSEDHSATETKEHIVNDYSIPGGKLTIGDKIGNLSKSKIITSPDGLDSLSLIYNMVDSTVVATLIQHARVLHQTIDRTIKGQANTSTDTRVKSDLRAVGSMESLIKINDRAMLEDTTKTVKRSFFSEPGIIIGIALVLLLGVLFTLTKLNIL